jgi:hypothetical protein
MANAPSERARIRARSDGAPFCSVLRRVGTGTIGGVPAL